jgi:chromosome segregation ATPase
LYIRTENRIENRRKRLGEINDRKIEILLEFSHINKRIEELESEYSKLDKEHYELWQDRN